MEPVKSTKVESADEKIKTAQDVSMYLIEVHSFVCVYSCCSGLIMWRRSWNHTKIKCTGITAASELNACTNLVS